MTEYFEEFSCDQCVKYSVVVEDDGRVCYAYLLFENAICGDVWLYNQSETPLTPEWDKKEEMPFLNSAEFVKDNYLKPITAKGEACVECFFFDGKCSIDFVKVFIRGELIAVLKHGSKPGWSTLVEKDGPLAKKLVHEKID